MDWFYKSVTLSIWEILLIGIYILVAHVYVLYRLAKFLGSSVSGFSTPKKSVGQNNQRPNNQSNDSGNDGNGLLRNAKVMKNGVDNQSEKDIAAEHDDKPFHSDKLIG
jgi:hypothetical protein